jgi:hypothetical protein
MATPRGTENARVVRAVRREYALQYKDFGEVEW